MVVDEAYIDFASRPGFLPRLSQYDNLVVLHTFSKAWGAAAVRLGMAFAHPSIIAVFNKIKYPYNINLLTQRYAAEMLDRYPQVRRGSTSWWLRGNSFASNWQRSLSSVTFTPAMPTSCWCASTTRSDVYDFLVGAASSCAPHKDNSFATIACALPSVPVRKILC